MRASAFTSCAQWRSIRCQPAWSASTAARADLHWLEPLQEAGRIILIDAAADGNPIGTVTRTTPRFSRD